jgi:putative IMPACT (imprinted ancient) family translation regulator
LTEKTVNEYYEVSFPYIYMNDVMRIFKEENIGLSEQSFEMECRIRINFRVSVKEKVTKRLERIDGLKYRYIETR